MLVPVHRLFFALQPPAPQAAAIGRTRDRLGAARSIVRDDRLHATLAITNDYPNFPEEEAARMIEIGDAAAAAPVPMALDRIVGTQRSVALRSRRCPPVLRELQHQLDAPLRRRGLARLGWSFSPHVTLFYWEGKPFEQRTDPIAWESSDFVLIHSVVGHTRHIELARWPLAPRQLSLLLH